MSALTRQKTARLSLPIAVLTVVGICLLIEPRSKGAMIERLLAADELMYFCGDSGSDPCYAGKNCRFAVTLGVGECMYCDAEQARKLCCKTGVNTKCEYSSNAVDSVCEHAGLVKGPKVGGDGTCGSCTGLSMSKVGTCTGLKQAIGNPCP